MRVLFDIAHPAHFHLFEHVIAQLRGDGSEVLITSRDKDETVELLNSHGLSHVCLSRAGRSLAGIGAEWVGRIGRLVRVARKFRPDVMVGKIGVGVAWAGLILDIPSVVVEDTEFARLQVGLCALPATVVCTGLGYGRRFPGKQVWFNAPPSLAYTHPSRFTADPRVLRDRGIDPEQPIIAMRLKAWTAIHDLGAKAPVNDEIEALVRGLARFGRPVISSERPLPASLAAYANPLPPGDLLHLLALARLYVGEGSCMAAEAACLGVPAIFLSPKSRRGYLDAIERKFGLVTTVQTAWQALAQASQWLGDPGLAGRCRAARQRLLAECDDPVELLVALIRRFAAKS